MSSIDVVLILLYCALFCVIIAKTKLFSGSNLSKGFLIQFFLIKLFIAFLHTAIQFKNGWLDTLSYFNSGKEIYNILPKHFLLYLRMVFGHVPEPFSDSVFDVLKTRNLPYYGLARSDFMVRLNAFFCLFSGGRYLVQVLFYQIFSFIGIFYIYLFCEKKLRNNKNILKYFIFFAPSVLFWLSGMHKEVPTVASIGFILFCYLQILNQISFKNVVGIIVGFFFLYLSRDYVALLFLLPFVALQFAIHGRLKTYWYYVSFGLIGIVLFFVSPLIHPSLNFPNKFVKYNQLFENLQGETSFKGSELEPTFQSFIQVLPKACFTAIVNPWIGSHHHNVLATFASIENIMYLILSFLCVLFANITRLSREQKAILYFFFFFAIGYFTLLGLIVNNAGALARYKAIPILFLGITLLSITDFSRVRKLL